MDLLELKKKLARDVYSLYEHLTHRECDGVIAFSQLKSVKKKFLEYLEADKNPEFTDVVGFAVAIDGLSQLLGDSEELERLGRVGESDNHTMDALRRGFY
jgi:hypothetical protein